MNNDVYKEFVKEWQQRMRDGKNIVHEYLAKPALIKKVGNVKGKDILCIGSGSGEECEMFYKAGAKSVTGIDLSPDFVDISKKSFPHLDFRVMDMEELDFAEKSFDIVVSSLTMHYVPSWNKTLSSIRKVLRDDGKVIITTNHPVRFGAETKRQKDQEVFLLGYIRYMDLKDLKKMGDVIGDYLNERRIDDKWFRGRFDVTYYTRPISAIFKDIRDSQFEILDFLEPKPEEWVEKENASFYHIHTKIPLFMLFELKKK